MNQRASLPLLFRFLDRRRVPEPDDHTFRVAWRSPGLMCLSDATVYGTPASLASARVLHGKACTSSNHSRSSAVMFAPLLRLTLVRTLRPNGRRNIGRAIQRLEAVASQVGPMIRPGNPREARRVVQ